MRHASDTDRSQGQVFEKNSKHDLCQPKTDSITEKGVPPIHRRALNDVCHKLETLTARIGRCGWLELVVAKCINRVRVYNCVELTQIMHDIAGSPDVNRKVIVEEMSGSETVQSFPAPMSCIAVCALPPLPLFVRT